jgi:2-desacetyl-2-hydroxyethyl bacteriochlorophyllide A dehydrogenase
VRALLFGGPHRLDVVDLPEPTPRTGEVKLRVEACGICGSDVHGYTGESGRRVAGQVMGHEFAGRIVEIGPNAEGWSVGDRVAAYNIVGCGHCRFCKGGNEQCCPDRKVIGVNTGTAGAFAEYVCVPARNLAKLSPNVDFATALLNEPLAVSYHALHHVPADARSLVVVGGGTIGQCLVAVCKTLGRFETIVVMEPVEEKRRMVERAGAVAIPPDHIELQRLLPGGSDASVEAVGVEATVLSALEAIRPGGTLVLLGNLAKTVALPLQHISSNEKHLVGTYGFSLADFAQVVAWINEGRFDLAPMITGRLSLEECPAAFADLASGRRQAVKLVVEPARLGAS